MKTISKKAILEYKKPQKAVRGYFYGKRKVIVPDYLVKILKKKPQTGKTILELLKLKPLVGKDAELVNWKYTRK